MPKIRAITFDFWSTLYAPRDRKQLEMIREAQFNVLRNGLAEAGFGLSLEAVQSAHQPDIQYTAQAVTLSDSVDMLCRRLDIDPLPEVRRRLVRDLESLAGQIEWTRAPGAPAVLRHFRQRDYLLGLIVNAHFPPARVLRQVLATDGLLMYFQVFSFSDEVGLYKPDPAIFRHALYHLDMENEPAAAVHVGDRPDADIVGARSAGMWTVRYAGFRNCTDPPGADVVIHNFRELPDLIHNWPL